jgi:zona occludens toxin
MPIVANVGLPGSGKTFDAVREKVITGVVQGRRVVTNIEGINPDRIYDYVERKYGIPADRMGEVVPVHLDRPGQPNFFPHSIHPADHPTDPHRVNDTDTVVKGGDLVVIDEARRFWDPGIKPSEEHKKFFAEHRHYTGKNNVSCDLVYICQDLSQIHRSFKPNTELTFRFKKLKSLGLYNSYVINQWEGTKLTKDLVVATYNKKYDPEIYPLYKSYSGSQPGKELEVDKRQNILRRPSLLLVVATVLVVCGGSLWYAIRFFSATPANASTSSSSSPGAPQARAAMPGSPNNPSIVPSPKPPRPSEVWRISGTLETRDGKFVLLVSKEGKSRLVQPDSKWTYAGGRYISGVVDDELVGTYTGVPTEKTTSLPPRNSMP